MTLDESSDDEGVSARASDSDSSPIPLSEPGGLAQMLRRRRLILIPALLLVLAGIVFATTVEGPTYTVVARVVVLSPPSPPAQEGGTPTEAGKTDNPLARTDQSVVVSVVAGMTNTESERTRLEEAGADPNYEVGALGGPVANITATSESAEEATKTAQIVSEAFIDNLAQLQAEQGIAPDYAISTLPLEEPTEPVATRSETLRLAIVIACAILAPVGVTVWVLESRLRSRRRGREVAEPESVDRPASPGGGEEEGPEYTRERPLDQPCTTEEASASTGPRSRKEHLFFPDDHDRGDAGSSE